MVGIGSILDEIKEFVKGKGYITERDLSNIIVKAELPLVLMGEVYDELHEMNIQVVENHTNPSNSSVDESKSKHCGNDSERLKRRVQGYVNRSEEFEREDGKKIIDEFYFDLAKPRMQYSYFPLVPAAFFERDNLTDQMPMNEMVQYFKKFYQDRKNKGLIIEKESSIFSKYDPTDSEIKRLILSNPLGRSCLVKYFRYDKSSDIVLLNENMYNSLTDQDVDKINDIVMNLILDYYNKLKNKKL